MQTSIAIKNIRNNPVPSFSSDIAVLSKSSNSGRSRKLKSIPFTPFNLSLCISLTRFAKLNKSDLEKFDTSTRSSCARFTTLNNLRLWILAPTPNSSRSPCLISSNISPLICKRRRRKTLFVRLIRDTYLLFHHHIDKNLQSFIPQEACHFCNIQILQFLLHPLVSLSSLSLSNHLLRY